MTNPKWLIGLIAIFVLFSVVCGLVEGTYLASTAGANAEPSRLAVLMNPWPPSWTYLTNFWSMFWFDYAFFDGGWVIFKYALFWPISIGLIASFVAQLVTYVRGLLPA